MSSQALKNQKITFREQQIAEGVAAEESAARLRRNSVGGPTQRAIAQLEWVMSAMRGGGNKEELLAGLKNAQDIIYRAIQELQPR